MRRCCGYCKAFALPDFGGSGFWRLRSLAAPQVPPIVRTPGWLSPRCHPGWRSALRRSSRRSLAPAGPGVLLDLPPSETVPVVPEGLKALADDEAALAAASSYYSKEYLDEVTAEQERQVSIVEKAAPAVRERQPYGDAGPPGTAARGRGEGQGHGPGHPHNQRANRRPHHRSEEPQGIPRSPAERGCVCPSPAPLTPGLPVRRWPRPSSSPARYW